MNVPQSFYSVLKNKKISLPVGGAALLLVFILTFATKSREALPTSEAKRGPFLVSIKTSGEIRAANNFTVTVPRTSYSYGQVQIVYLVAEGTTVKAGDVIVRFTTSEIDKRIADKESELSILKSDYAKLKADIASRMADLNASLKNAELAFEQAKLQVEKMKFEAEVQRKEAEINLDKAKISYEQAQTKIESQKIVDGSDEKSSLLKIQQNQSDITRAKQDKDLYTMKAPIPGLVVYETNWSTGRKVSVGDSPWPGMPLISLPDLSKMQSLINVNEVDISKVKKGQSAKISLDAFPDRQFTGVVTSVATIGRQADRSSSLKTFEVVLDVDQTDPVLKPGMTSSNEIVMETIPDTLYIPLEAVFEKEGKAIVYRLSGSTPKAQEVTLGTKNSNFVIISRGLQVGDRVSLVDPTAEATSVEASRTGKGTQL